MATVRTQAGMRLLANEAMNARSFALITPAAIAAIEAEAAAIERERLAGLVRLEAAIVLDDDGDGYGGVPYVPLATVLALLGVEP